MNYIIRKKMMLPQPLANNQVIDYKDVELLRKYVMDNGRIIPSRLIGTSAKQQRRLTKAIKIARYLALLPYTDKH